MIHIYIHIFIINVFQLQNLIYVEVLVTDLASIYLRPPLGPQSRKFVGSRNIKTITTLKKVVFIFCCFSEIDFGV